MLVSDFGLLSFFFLDVPLVRVLANAYNGNFFPPSKYYQTDSLICVGWDGSLAEIHINLFVGWVTVQIAPPPPL